MVKMEEIQAAMDLKMNRSADWRSEQMVRLKDQGDKIQDTGKDRLNRSEGGLKELVLKWFVETQASHILCDGNFPSWFHGFISRQEAEDHLRDKTLGCFLIRLSEKACSYILSYRGQDRCRHFVINQTNDCMLVVSGDSVHHSGLPALIEHFKITPIQPFGECLTSEREEECCFDDVYDVVHCKPNLKLGVSVQALRSLWDQRSEVTASGPPSLPPKSRNLRLVSSTSIERESDIQAVPTVLKKNLPLRNSLSANLIRGHLSHGSEQHSQLEQKWSSTMGTDDGLNPRWRTCVSGNESYGSLDSHMNFYSEHGGHFSTADGQNNSYQINQSRSLPYLDGNHSNSLHPVNQSPTTQPHLPSLPPKSSSISSSLVQFMEQNEPGPSDLTHTNLKKLQPNPLYQTSFGLCVGHNSGWGPHSQLEPSRLAEIPSESNNDPITPENTYQDITEHQKTNTYEDLLAVKEGNFSAQENNTYEDIPTTHDNTYASVEELHPAQSNLGKKNHKWWKFLPESKKK